MSKIKILSKEIVAKIAAGEVVEDPASVVKELIDNAIDAEADRIEIKIEDSGLKKIFVSDNGMGIEKDDLKKTIKLHATSKLESEEDLLRLNSLGFRGEALSSIASVSDFFIKSKSESSELGYKLEKQSNEETILKEVAMNDGTRVEVKNLFTKVPARLQFLNSKNYLYRKILNVVNQFALVFPKIDFSLKSNNKEILRFFKDDSLERRIRMILGEDVLSQLIEFKASSAYAKIHGFVGRPQVALQNKSKQYIFINNRFVRYSKISRTIKNTFSTLLSPKEQPIFIIFIQVPANILDVNIHPRKEEVKILNEKEFFKILEKSLKTVFKENDLGYAFVEKDINSNDFDRNSADILKNQTKIWSLKKEDYKNAEIIQIDHTYLALQSDDGVTLIDQHAAHERILFEELKDSYKNLTSESHELEKAKVFEMPQEESELLMENLKLFSELGFVIEDFGKNIFKITKVPFFFKDRNIQKLIKEILEDIKISESPKELDLQTEKTLYYMACRMAIKAGEYLTMEERRRLLEKLQKTNFNYTCPHGRPVKVTITKNELEKMFKRR